MKLEIIKKISSDGEIIDNYSIKPVKTYYPGDILENIENVMTESIDKWILPDYEQVINDLFEKSLLKKIDENDEYYNDYLIRIIFWTDNSISLIVKKKNNTIYKRVFNHKIEYGKNI